MTRTPLFVTSSLVSVKAELLKQRESTLPLIHILVSLREVLLKLRRQRGTVKESLLNFKEVRVTESDALVRDDVTQNTARDSRVNPRVLPHTREAGFVRLMKIFRALSVRNGGLIVVFAKNRPNARGGNPTRWLLSIEGQQKRHGATKAT